MKKEKLNFLVQVIIFLAGFLPWMKFEGKYCSVINVLIKGFSGEFGAGGIGNPLFLWAFFLLISYSVYPILCYRIWKQKDWEKTESVAFYLGTIGFIAFQTVFGICLLVVDKEIDFVPFQFLRSAVIVIWYFVNRYLYDLPNEKTVRFRMKKRKTRPDAWWFYIITSVISVISILFAKWVCIGKYSYTVIGFLTKSAQNGGFLKFLEKITGNSLSGNMEAYGMISVSFYLLYVLLVIVILSVIRCILFCKNRNASVFGKINYLLAFIFYFIFFSTGAYKPGVGFYILLCVLPLEFIIGLYLEQRKEIKEEYLSIKEHEKAIEAEKKRRLHFPGKYSLDFYKVIWHSFCYNWRSYILFAMCAVIITVILYVMLSIKGYEMLPVIVFFSVLMLALAITYYLQIRINSNSVYYALGIRKRTLGIMIAFECGCCLIGALAVGILLGEVSLYCLKYIFDYNIHSFNLGITGMTFGVFALVILIAFLINYHLFEHRSLLKPTVSSQRDERIPEYFSCISIIIGLIISGITIVKYQNIYQGESVLLKILMLTGCFLMFYGLAAILIRLAIRRMENHEEKLLDILPWRHCFRTNYCFWYLLFAFPALAGMVYLPEIASIESSKNIESMYPYEFACMTYEEDELYFGKLQEKYKVQIKTVPMTRITTPLGEKYSWEQTFSGAFIHTLWPQGQHIGIAESSYYDLGKYLNRKSVPRLGLNGEEVHIVFQQDCSVRAHPLDWYMGMKAKPDKDITMLKMGYPTEYAPYAVRETTFPKYNIKSSERQILTGMFGEGKREDIVVFSDEYFEKNLSKEGPHFLKLINCDKKDYNSISAALKDYMQKHSGDSKWDSKIQPFYGKNEVLTKTCSIYMTRKVSYILIAAILLLTTLFVFYMKYEMERKKTRKKLFILDGLGMPVKEQKKLLQKEMYIFIWSSYVAAIIPSLIFAVSIVKIRMFTTAEIIAFWKKWCLFFLIYTIIYASGTFILQKHHIRRIIKKNP